jgi:hypothetical protein
VSRRAPVSGVDMRGKGNVVKLSRKPPKVTLHLTQRYPGRDRAEG